MLRESLGRVVEGKDLDIEAMTAAVGAIMEGQATDAQIGAFLTALRLKGESGEEIAGAAMALRTWMVHRLVISRPMTSLTRVEPGETAQGRSTCRPLQR